MRTARTLPFLVLLILLAAACSGTNAPTPLASSLPSSLPSIDVGAICDAGSEASTDLTAIGDAAADTAGGAEWSLDDAEARIDRVVAELEGLDVAAEAATGRDAAVTALEQLKSELPAPGQETAQTVSDAVDGLDSVRTAICG